MSKAKDLTGQTYNRLTFTLPTERRGKKGDIIWEAICSCGNIWSGLPDKVKKGKTKSCGCLLREEAYTMYEANRLYDPRIGTARKVWMASYYDCDWETFYTLSQQNCHYCGSVPSQTYRIKKTATKPISDYQITHGDFIYNGLDRIDSNLGHIIGNIVPCCFTCNRSKSDLTLKDFLFHIEKMYLHTKTMRDDILSREPT